MINSSPLTTHSSVVTLCWHHVSHFDPVDPVFQASLDLKDSLDPTVLLVCVETKANEAPVDNRDPTGAQVSRLTNITLGVPVTGPQQ